MAEDKLPKTNALTKSAGLTFNVNTIKNKIKEYYESQNLPVFMFSGGHIGVTAMMEKLVEIIIKECSNHVAKDKAGTKQINRQTLNYSILLNPALCEYYKMKLEKFDKDQLYSDQLPVDKKELDAIINRLDKDIVLTPKGMNLLCYCLIKAYTDVISTAHQFISCYDKKALTGKVINYSIKNRFADGITHQLTTAVNTAMKLSDETYEETNNVDDEDNIKEPKQQVAEQSADEGENVDAVEEEDKSVKKGAKKAKSAKSTETVEPSVKGAKGAKSTKTAKSVPQIEQEPEEGEEELEKELEEEEQEVEVVEAKPAKSVKSVKTVAKTASAKSSSKPAPKGK